MYRSQYGTWSLFTALTVGAVATGCTGQAASLFSEAGDQATDTTVPGATDDPLDADGGTVDAGGGLGTAGEPGDEPADSKGEPGAGALTIETACASATVGAEEVEVEVAVDVAVQVEVQVPQPVAMYVMLDRSRSMTVMDQYPEELWEPSVDALSTFVNDEGNADLSMALQYFPIEDAYCDGAGYATPAVPMAPIGEERGTLLSSLSTESPDGRSTPTEGALRGATQYCEQYLADHDGKCVVVLVTDGQPNGCAQKRSDLVDIVAAASSEDLLVYTVGLTGADFELLNALALAGGADDCHPDDDGRFACDISNGPEQLNATLKQIQEFVTTTETVTETQIKTELRTQPLVCEWKMPSGDDQVPIAPDLVNVTSSFGGDDPWILGRVPTENDCQLGGWYYDDNVDPTRIKACSETCELLTDGSYDQVDILLGCETLLLLE